MSLSPFLNFKSRFVTYLLTFPRNLNSGCLFYFYLCYSTEKEVTQLIGGALRHQKASLPYNKWVDN